MKKIKPSVTAGKGLSPKLTWINESIIRLKQCSKFIYCV